MRRLANANVHVVHPYTQKSVHAGGKNFSIKNCAEEKFDDFDKWYMHKREYSQQNQTYTFF